MGILYNAAMAEKTIKRRLILERLKELKVTVSRQGVPIDQLDYYDLRHELVLASIRQE